MSGKKDCVLTQPEGTLNSKPEQGTLPEEGHTHTYPPPHTHTYPNPFPPAHSRRQAWLWGMPSLCYSKAR